MSLSSDTRPCSRDRSLLAVLQVDWRNMILHHETKDLELVVGEKEESIPAHRIVLIARCNKLREKLGQTKKKLVFKHLEIQAVKTILQYVYSAEIDVTNAVEITPLLMVSYEFGIPALRSYLLQCLELLITQDNVCKIQSMTQSLLSISHVDEDLKIALWSVVDLCLQYILRNIKQIFQSDNIFDLDKQSLILIVSSKLQISNQEILKSILRWGRYKAGTSKTLQSDWSEKERALVRSHIEDIIPHIHLKDGQMSPDSISDGVYGIFGRHSWTETDSVSLESGFPKSSILNDRTELQAQLIEWCGSNQWLMIYQASSHGYSARAFHKHCDNYEPTVVIIQTDNDHIFGGYCDVSWSSQNRRGKYASSQNAFLFSLVNPTLGTTPKRFFIRQPVYAINNHPNNGPIFGSGADLCISSNGNVNKDSYSRIPCSYGDKHTHPNSLAGTTYFQVKDYEVFSLQLDSSNN